MQASRALARTLLTYREMHSHYVQRCLGLLTLSFRAQSCACLLMWEVCMTFWSGSTCHALRCDSAPLPLVQHAGLPSPPACLALCQAPALAVGGNLTADFHYAADTNTWLLSRPMHRKDIAAMGQHGEVQPRCLPTCGCEKSRHCPEPHPASSGRQHSAEAQ